MVSADTPLDAVTQLRQVADALRAGAAGDAGQWLAARLDAYLIGAKSGVTLEAALGIKVDVGGEAWWTAENRKRRDDAVAEYIARCSASDPGLEIKRYESGAWLRDRRAAEMPPAYAGTAREFLHRALRTNKSVAPGRMPSSLAYLRRVLASHSTATKKDAHEISLFVTTARRKLKIAKG